MTVLPPFSEQPPKLRRPKGEGFFLMFQTTLILCAAIVLGLVSLVEISRAIVERFRELKGQTETKKN